MNHPKFWACILIWILCTVHTSWFAIEWGHMFRICMRKRKILKKWFPYLYANIRYLSIRNFLKSRIDTSFISFLSIEFWFAGGICYLLFGFYHYHYCCFIILLGNWNFSDSNIYFCSPLFGHFYSWWQTFDWISKWII